MDSTDDEGKLEIGSQAFELCAYQAHVMLKLMLARAL